EFDAVLLDAPCSGESLTRRGEPISERWDQAQEKISALAHLQQKLVSSAFEALRPGGVMVYSTCTLNIHENEGVVAFLEETYKDAVERMPLLELPGTENETWTRELGGWVVNEGVMSRSFSAHHYLNSHSSELYAVSNCPVDEGIKRGSEQRFVESLASRRPFTLCRFPSQDVVLVCDTLRFNSFASEGHVGAAEEPAGMRLADYAPGPGGRVGRACRFRLAVSDYVANSRSAKANDDWQDGRQSSGG
ncbi:unnamed protein product, partial [Polarella glacialis]